jgi:glycosyltransferase involved in cell wall biosynthesis
MSSACGPVRCSVTLRVLHVQRAKGVSGSERHLLSLLPALADEGVESRMCVLSTGEGQRFVDALSRAGIDVRARNGGGHLNARLVPELVSEIRAFRPHLVHTHLFHADVMGQIAAYASRVPAVSSVHSTDDFYRREPYRSAGRLVGAMARRRIAISHHVERYVEELRLAPRDRIRVVYYGIDVDRWLAAAPGRAAARSRFDVPDGVFVVGIAARLIAGKGHPTLIEAVGRMARDGIAVSLLVAGEGEERDRLEALARRCCPEGTVRFLGFVPDVEALLAACDVVAFPTDDYAEGFGLTALEAMAAGRPVVATRYASLPEVVDDGVTGALVPPKSVDAMRVALVALANDPTLGARQGDAGARRAREVFGLGRMAAETRAVYDEALRRRG